MSSQTNKQIKRKIGSLDRGSRFLDREGEMT